MSSRQQRSISGLNMIFRAIQLFCRFRAVMSPSVLWSTTQAQREWAASNEFCTVRLSNGFFLCTHRTASDVSVTDVLPPNAEIVDGKLTHSWSKIAAGSTVEASYVLKFTAGGSMEVQFLPQASVSYKADSEGSAQVGAWSSCCMQLARHVHPVHCMTPAHLELVQCCAHAPTDSRSYMSPQIGESSRAGIFLLTPVQQIQRYALIVVSVFV